MTRAIHGVAAGQRRAGVGEHELVRLLGRLLADGGAPGTARATARPSPCAIGTISSLTSLGGGELHAAGPVVGRDLRVALDDVAGDVPLAEARELVLAAAGVDLADAVAEARPASPGRA